MTRHSALPTLGALPLLCIVLSGCVHTADNEAETSPTDHSMSPAADVVYECLLAKGWEVSITWDGGIEASSNEIPDAQVSLYEDDSAECWSIIDERVAAYDVTDIVKVYDMELTTRECLIEQGLNVEEPPSEQQYIDTFHGDRWMAYGASDIDTALQDQAQWKEIAQACPQPAWSLGAHE